MTAIPAATGAATSESWLVARGLLGSGMFGESARRDTIVPSPGADVSNTRQTDTRGGRLLMEVESWEEPVGDDTIHIEVSTFPSHRHAVAFWIFPHRRSGCVLFQWTLYDDGAPLQSRYWRSEPELVSSSGSCALPPGLYPDAVPWTAFLRVLEAPREGAVGVLNQQITPGSYVGQDVSATNVECVRVIAGKFAALKVTAQLDVATILPNWPRVLVRMMRSVVPVNTLHFEAAPPHRLVKQQGVTFVGGPEVTTELVRSYTASSPREAARAQVVSSSLGRSQ